MYVFLFSIVSILSSIVSSLKETLCDFRIKKKKKKKYSDDECIAEIHEDKDIEVVQAQLSLDVALLWELAKSLVHLEMILVKPHIHALCNVSAL